MSHSVYQKTIRGLVFTIATILFFSVSSVMAAGYGKKVVISAETKTTRISGFRGSETTLRVAKTGHAMYGISSWELRDQPCYVKLLTEDVNDTADDQGVDIRDRCGFTASSKEMRVFFSDSGLNEQRVFVSGIRVCMNEKGTRVKGFQLRGKKITDDGKVIALPADKDIANLVEPLGYRLAPAVLTNNDRNEPFGYRSNCLSSNWKRWAQCSHPLSIATGLVAHFEAGKKPRSLTGLGLQCQQIKQTTGRAGS